MQKLGKLTKVQKVYRGISGGVLPDEFWNRNEFNVRGGVEFAFTST
jgi:NLR family CARD domain-containing protein 3